MVFHPPSWTPSLEQDPPDSITIGEFILQEQHGRLPFARSRPCFTCGVSGKTYTAAEVQQRVEFLARGLANELKWSPNEGSEWEKVAGVFSANALDFLPLAWAVHRLGGIQSPANAQYSASEVAYQLKDSGAKCLFTCAPLLSTALDAAKQAGLPRTRVYLLDVPGPAPKESVLRDFTTVDQLIQRGSKIVELEALRWAKGDGARRTAFLCYSSGTSGLPKGVMISHRNVIANVLQICAFDKPFRDTLREPGQVSHVENALGLLPMSHIYSLVVVCHTSAYRGDGVIVLPKFDPELFLAAIQKYRINTLYLVPPIIIWMMKNKETLDKYDLKCVRTIFTGAAPLGKETAEELAHQYPHWLIRQGYGLTETSTVVCSTSATDIWYGSSGSLLPSIQAKIVSANGDEITEYDKPGEVWVRSPAVTLGYLNNPKANKETFVTDHQGRWMRTGDEAVVRVAPSGTEHIFIMDRIKELIKVKGLQVAPAELEAHLLTHPHVADCAVIPVTNEQSGEVPKAFVVKSPSIGLEESDRMIAREIIKHVEREKSRHKWLKGGVEFIDAIPKSPSGKILRRLLRDREKETRKRNGAKL